MFLKDTNITRYQISKSSGIAETTLLAANSKEVSRMSVSIIQAIAMVVGKPAGVVLDELLKLEGNPVIKFIREHPGLNHDLVQKAENLMIDANEMGINLNVVSFNRYYEKSDDTTENAEIALNNFIESLKRIMNKLNK